MNTLEQPEKIKFIEGVCKQRFKEAVVNFNRAVDNLAKLPEPQRTIFIQCLPYLQELLTENEPKAAVNAVCEKLEAQYPLVSHAQDISLPSASASSQLPEAETLALALPAPEPSVINLSMLFPPLRQTQAQNAQPIADAALTNGS